MYSFFYVFLPILFTRFHATCTQAISSDECPAGAAAEECHFQNALLYAQLGGVIAACTYIAQSLLLGGWRTLGARRMWHLSVEGRPLLKFFLVILNSCIWTACPVFIASVVRDRQIIEADWWTEGVFCTRCHGPAAYFAGIAACVTLTLSIFLIAIKRHTFKFYALIAVLAVADEAILKVGTMRATRELHYARKAVLTPNHLQVKLDLDGEGSASKHLRQVEDELNVMGMRTPSCWMTAAMRPPGWFESRCYGSELRNDASALASLILLHSGLNEDNCADVLARTATRLYTGRGKLHVGTISFQGCSVTATYQECAVLQAQQLVHEQKGSSDIEVLYTVVIRADAYDLCAYHGLPSVLSRGGIQSQALLEAVAQLPTTRRLHAEHLRSLAKFAAARFESISSFKLTNGVHTPCDAGAIARILPIAQEALLIRRVGRVALPLHGAILWDARCTAAASPSVVQLVKSLDSLEIADCEMLELLGDELSALGKASGKSSKALIALQAYRKAIAAAGEWHVLRMWRIKSKIAALEAIIAQTNAGRSGGRPSSPPTQGRFKAPAPPPPPVGDRTTAGCDNCSCKEKALAGDAFALLGLNKASCTKRDARKNFRQRALQYHPDKYIGSQECGEMHFQSLKGARDRVMSLCKD